MVMFHFKSDLDAENKQTEKLNREKSEEYCECW